MRAHIALCLILLTPSLAGARSDATIAQSQDCRRVIRVTAERFAFTPSEIVVEKGTTIEFHLTSDDTDHGFRIVGTDVERRDSEAPAR